MLKGFVAGVFATVAAGLLAAYALIASGRIPANADTSPPHLERWAARKSLHATLRREAPKEAPPIPAAEANLLAGAKIYAANCAVCHGAADGKASNIAKGLYQRAPQLGRRGVEDDPEGETYWIVRHGVRLTGMPSFSKTLTDTELWQVALFLKHMDQLPPAAEAAWKAIPSQAKGGDDRATAP